MTDSERLAWIKLGLVFERRGQKLVELLRCFSLPEDIFEVPPALLARVVGVDDAAALCGELTQARAERAAAWLGRTADAGLLTLTDPAYPPDLLRSGVAEATLFTRGDPALLRRPMVLMGFSSRVNRAGRQDVAEFARGLARRGVSPVFYEHTKRPSEAMCEVLRGLEGAILVSPASIDFPAIDGLFAPAGGLVLSPFAPRLEVDLMDARERSAALATGLARGMLVASTENYGPVIDLARQVADSNRGVTVLPGSFHSVWHRGNHRLINEGAWLTLTVDDVINDLGLSD